MVESATVMVSRCTSLRQDLRGHCYLDVGASDHHGAEAVFSPAVAAVCRVPRDRRVATVRVPALFMPPPSLYAEFPEIVELLT